MDVEVRTRRAEIEDLPALQAMQVRAVSTLCASRLAREEIDATLSFMLAVEVARVAAGTAWLAETTAGRIVAVCSACAGVIPAWRACSPGRCPRCRHTAARQHAFAEPASIRTSPVAASPG